MNNQSIFLNQLTTFVVDLNRFLLKSCLNKINVSVTTSNNKVS